MDTLDSRALRFTDCYAQRFMKPGRYAYHVVTAMSHCVSSERPFTIQVGESVEQTMKQHSVVIRQKGGRFTVEPETLSIGAGDLVLWHCSATGAVPHMIVGDKEFFSSDRLVNESGYSHAFGSADQYEWVDAYGSGASGIVRVRDAECRSTADFQRWRQQLAKGTLVTITGTSAEPREIDILTGQTVFFIVTKGPGISITDRRLLGGEERRSERPAQP
jgi:plastocyanin